ncbi:hypothetical protein [Pseudomonas sp. HMWF021]|uniref:hypothetical protein n=1 Tax=Pseudomonas sp. HMWF021 TaxID=2056857 RepID=UPI0011B21D9D|nr:hypothetical protein [Pseudomonas sp. HMWF021]
MIKDHLSTVALVVGLALSAFSLKQLISAPAIDLTATVESSTYKSHPSIQAYIDGALKDVSEIEADLEKEEIIKDRGFSTSQILVVANLLRKQAYNTKYSFNNDASTFLLYKIENTGDKAATNVGLVNSLDGVALIEGTAKSIRISGKEPIVLGEIPPRSTKVVYFWTSDYFYSRGSNSFVKYSDGTIDVDAKVSLGGVYRHFDEYGIIYQFAIFTVLLFLSIFLFERYYNKTPSTPAVQEQAKPKRRRRRVRRKSTPDTQPKN